VEICGVGALDDSPSEPALAVVKVDSVGQLNGGSAHSIEDVEIKVTIIV
jgi:hypothetical protein